MARTPLMRSLIQFARDHSIARRRGVPVDAIREDRALANERRGTGMTRRQFLVGSAAATVAGLALPRWARGAGQPRIAIVGGGIAGMTTALTLADAGIAATVYEASQRIGGRMFSNTSGYWNDGQISEWGGELIDTSHKTVLALCRRFDLETTSLLQFQPNSSEDTYHFFGGFYAKADADRDFQPVHRALQDDVQAASYPTTYLISTTGGRALDAMSVYDWIESRVPGGHGSRFGALLDVAYNIEYGADTTQQSALNLVYLIGYKAVPGNFSMYGASNERYHIRGGNQRLPQTIAASLGNSIQLGMRLMAIAKNPDGTVALTFSTGSGTSVVTADLVALTLPFAVLRTIDYRRAGFDGLKDQSIQELGRGHNGKLQLQFADRFWNGFGAWPGKSTGQTFSDRGYQLTWDVSRGQAGQSGILVDYTGGSVTDGMTPKVAFSSAPDKAVVSDAKRFLGQIEPVYPGLTSRWNGKATSSVWHLDPTFLASYSYWRPGQYAAFAGYEGVPQGNVFFAGEHTSQDAQGFMEGGASEGIRCGGEILGALGLK